jgi:hypothetical protein
VRFVELLFRSGRSVDSRKPAFRIDHPDHARTGIEPISDFGQYFAWAIVVRQHLYHEVGRELEIAGWNWSWGARGLY